MATCSGRGVVTIVPLTSNVARIYPFQVLLPATRTGLPVDSKAQPEQVRAVAAERVGDRVGLVPVTLMQLIDAALRLHLTSDPSGAGQGPILASR